MSPASADRRHPSTLLWRHPSTRRRIRVQLGKIGRILTHICGLPCSACGSTKYQVVLRHGGPVMLETLVGNCTGCHAQRDLETESLRNAVRFRYGLHQPDLTHPLS